MNKRRRRILGARIFLSFLAGKLKIDKGNPKSKFRQPRKCLENFNKQQKLFLYKILVRESKLAKNCDSKLEGYLQKFAFQGKSTTFEAHDT